MCLSAIFSHWRTQTQPCDAETGTAIIRCATPIYAPLGSRSKNSAAPFWHRRIGTCHASPYLPSPAHQPCCRSAPRTGPSLLPLARRDAYHSAQPVNNLSAHCRRPLPGTRPPGWAGLRLAVHRIAVVDRQSRRVSNISFTKLMMGSTPAAGPIKGHRSRQDQATRLFSFRWRTSSARTGSLPFASSSKKSAHSCTISRR